MLRELLTVKQTMSPGSAAQRGHIEPLQSHPRASSSAWLTTSVQLHPWNSLSPVKWFPVLKWTLKKPQITYWVGLEADVPSVMQQKDRIGNLTHLSYCMK